MRHSPEGPIPPPVGSVATMSIAMRVRLGVIVALGFVLMLAGCGTNAPSRADVLKALETSGIAPAEAQCSVQAIYDNLTTQQVADLYDRGFGGVPKDNPTDSGDAATRLATAMGKCRDAAAAPTNPQPSGQVATTTTPNGAVGSDDSQVDSTGPSLTRGAALVPNSDAKSSTSKVPTGSNNLNDAVPSTTQAGTTNRN